MTIPAAAVESVLALLEDLGSGRTIAVVPYDLEVGSETAAELLNVSSTWIRTLANRNDLPMRREGKHRRFRLGDVVGHRRVDAARRLAMQDVAMVDAEAELDGLE